MHDAEQQTAKQYLSMAQAARRCPSRPHPSALYRWARRGLKSRAGRWVRLKHCRAGRGLYTTLDWLECFFEELAEADLPHFRAHNDDDQEALGRASQELDRAGL